MDCSNFIHRRSVRVVGERRYPHVADLPLPVEPMVPAVVLDPANAEDGFRFGFVMQHGETQQPIGPGPVDVEIQRPTGSAGQMALCFRDGQALGWNDFDGGRRLIRLPALGTYNLGDEIPGPQSDSVGRAAAPWIRDSEHSRLWIDGQLDADALWHIEDGSEKKSPVTTKDL